MNGKIIDLTLDIYDGAPVMPGDPPCQVASFSTLETAGFNLAQLSLSTHQGTHLDAPFHIFADGAAVDRLDLDRCIGPAFKIDLRPKKPREAIDLEDLLPYDDRIRPGARIILQTGWDKFRAGSDYFTSHPYLTGRLADWLADRQIGLLGLDMPSPAAEGWRQIHEKLLARDIVIVEGLANLDQITAAEFTLIALPLKIRKQDGSPVRAVAIEP